MSEWERIAREWCDDGPKRVAYESAIEMAERVYKAGRIEAYRDAREKMGIVALSLECHIRALEDGDE